MKLTLIVLGSVVLIVVVVVAVGAMLPVAHVAARTIELAQPPEVVFGTIHDVEHYASWWSDVQRVEMLPPVNGRVRFTEHMSDGPIVMELVEARHPARMVTRIADPDQPFGGTWTFEIAPTADGSRLTITEHGEVYNPLFRFLSRFVLGHTGTIDSYLRALGRRFGADVVPA